MKSCGVCGSGCDPRLHTCWVCGNRLDGEREPAGPAASATWASGDVAMLAFGWAFLMAGIAFVGLLVGVELAFEWPGLLIPYALIQLVVFAGLGRVAWVHIKRRRDAKPSEGEGSAEGGPNSDTATKVATGVGLVLAGIMITLAVVLLLIGAAFVLFLLVCVGVLMVAEMH